MTERLAAIKRALDGYRMDEARALAQEEVTENPSAAAYYLAAQAALTQGERVRYLRKAQTLDPAYPFAADELAAIAPAEKRKSDGVKKPKRESAARQPEPTESEPAIQPAEAALREEPARRMASFSRRWLAIIIDGCVVGAATLLALFAGGAVTPLDAAMESADPAALSDAFAQFQSTTLAVNLVVSAVYNVALMVIFNGQTLGKMMLRLRVVKKRGGSITILDALLRNVFGYMISQIFLLGYLWALFDREKQTWHDKMAGTVVMEERRTATARPVGGAGQNEKRNS